ncbi:MAG: hypothetical protein QM538_03720 [Methylacidiphilales bacterium]|nr:hypothetical protein [Candidatus Methylacidiphilales bacterium]
MERSPFEHSVSGISKQVGSFFRKHDAYLNIALLLCFVPIPLAGLLAFIIGVVGALYQAQNLFPTNERLYISVILFLAIVNTILFTYLYYSYILSLVTFFKSLLMFLVPDSVQGIYT